MIKKVKQNVNVPLIVGGGLRTVEQINDAFKAGADVVVIGTAIEKDVAFLHRLKEIKK